MGVFTDAGLVFESSAGIGTKSRSGNGLLHLLHRSGFEMSPASSLARSSSCLVVCLPQPILIGF